MDLFNPFNPREAVEYPLTKEEEDYDAEQASVLTNELFRIINEELEEDRERMLVGLYALKNNGKTQFFPALANESPCEWRDHIREIICQRMHMLSNRAIRTLLIHAEPNDETLHLDQFDDQGRLMRRATQEVQRRQILGIW